MQIFYIRSMMTGLSGLEEAIGGDRAHKAQALSLWAGLEKRMLLENTTA